mgnify:CR=1 FL=1
MASVWQIPLFIFLNAYYYISIKNEHQFYRKQKTHSVNCVFFKFLIKIK